MRILLVHNHYQSRGGEDSVFESELKLLRGAGLEVQTWTVDNRDIQSVRDRIRTALATPFSFSSLRKARRIMSEFRPQIVHAHNVFPQISPSVYWAAREFSARVVQTLHNFRLICPGGLLLRAGRPCVKCPEFGSVIPAVFHRCYRNSVAGSAVVAGMLGVHGILRTWRSKVDVMIAPSEFARNQLIAGGLPADRIVVRENFIDPDPGAGPSMSERDRACLFVGRLSEEKGVRQLLSAWAEMGDRAPELRIIGDGPLESWMHENSRVLSSVKMLGRLPQDRILAEMKRARLLVAPSVFYEIGPRVQVEAFATGTPGIFSNHGSLPSLADSESAFFVDVFSAGNIARVVLENIDRIELLNRMASAARELYLDRFSGPAALRGILKLYRGVLGGFEG